MRRTIRLQNNNVIHVLSSKRDILKSRINYIFHARHYNGYGIHSPYIYNLITHVLDTRYHFYAYEQIEHVWAEMRLLAKDGNKPNLNVSDRKKIASILKAEKSEKEIGRMLFSLIHNMKAECIIETNFSGSADSAYMAKAKPHAHCFCFTDNQGMSDFANEGFRRLGIENIQLFSGNKASELEKLLESLDNVDLVLFSIPAKKKDILHDFQICLKKKHTNSIFVIKHIHSSHDMESIWQTITNNPEVCVSMDLYSMGLLFFRPDLEKRKYVIRK